MPYSSSLPTDRSDPYHHRSSPANPLYPAKSIPFSFQLLADQTDPYHLSAVPPAVHIKKKRPKNEQRTAKYENTMETLAQQAPEGVEQRQGSSGRQVQTEAAIKWRQG